MGSNVPSGSPLGDPTALEQYFRAHFDDLAQEAKAHLADAASSAPRVVEGAFRHAWEERQHFHTPQELDAFLHEEVRHGAAREKSRRAGLHRHDGAATRAHAPAVPKLDVDQSWSHVAHALHLVPDSGTAVQESAAHLRHDAAGHVADLAKPRAWKAPLAIGVGAAIVIAGGIWYLQRLGDEGAIQKALAAPDARTHIAAPRQLAIVSLDDGTKVLLTPESKLVVPKNYGELLRAVKLEGAATFTVAAAEARPFEVRAGNAKVVATGTVLTVRAFPTESVVVVHVKQGSVSVQAGDSIRQVAENHAMLVARSGAMREPTPTEVQEATSWDDHTLTISNRQLRETLPQLKRWYGLDIKVPDLTLLDRPVTMQASLESPQEALNAIEKSANVKFGYEGQSMVFRDAAVKKAAKKK
jgi:ferric-dicitrate binding protein FerR (iron transport regulator)